MKRKRAINREISIHTALAGCDSDKVQVIDWYYKFQSTQPSQAVTAIIPNINKIPTNIIIYNA